MPGAWPGGLLGGAADDRAASFVEEEEANKEAPHGQRDSDDAGEQDRQPDDLKVVLASGEAGPTGGTSSRMTLLSTWRRRLMLMTKRGPRPLL